MIIINVDVAAVQKVNQVLMSIEGDSILIYVIYIINCPKLSSTEYDLLKVMDIGV